MMRPLRAFLLIRAGQEKWSVGVHRDLESLLDAWKSASLGEAPVTGVIHIGFGRPEAAAFDDLAARHTGHLLLTASARFTIDSLGACSSQVVGFVEGIPIYVSTDKMRQISSSDNLSTEKIGAMADDAGEHTVTYPNAESYPPLIPITSSWFSALMNIEPDLANEAVKVGITDEASYLFFEWKLESALRKRLGLSRLKILLGSKWSDDPSEIIRFSPPWILGEPVSTLYFTVRASNALQAAGIRTIGDLSKYDVEALYKIPNLGLKSIREIADAILRMVGIDSTNHRKEQKIEVTRRENDDDVEIPSIEEATNIIDALYQTISGLTERKRLVMKYRMGFNVKRSTLHEIATSIGVTRERVRQIESKTISQIVNLPIWRQTLVTKLGAIIADRDGPLPLLGLEILDPWFTGIEEIPETFDFVLENFCASAFSIVRTNNQMFVSKLSQHEWDEAVSKGRQILEGAVGENWRESQVRSAVDALLILEGREMRGELWVTVSKNAHFASVDGEEPVLVQYGRGAEQYVEVVLAESDRPLHYTEIAREVRKRSGRDHDIRRVHNAAAEVGLLMGRGTYGLMKHYPISDDEVDLVVAETESIVESGVAGRQWSCAELCDVLGERGIEFDGRLTHYSLNIALQRSKSLAYLGRFVWSLAEGARLSSAHRIDVRQAIVSLLRAEGRPLPFLEIKSRITHDRGLSAHFQIVAVDPLIQLASGVWGLIDRDLPFNEAEQASVMEELESVLHKRGSGLHASEIVKALTRTREIVNRVKDPELILALAKRTGRMSFGYGQVLYLPEWGEPRRIRQPDAIKMALGRAGSSGLRIPEIVESVSQIIGRNISRDNIYTSLSSVGARWDEETGRWSLVETEDPIDDADAKK